MVATASTLLRLLIDRITCQKAAFQDDLGRSLEVTREQFACERGISVERCFHDRFVFGVNVAAFDDVGRRHPAITFCLYVHYVSQFEQPAASASRDQAIVECVVYGCSIGIVDVLFAIGVQRRFG